MHSLFQQASSLTEEVIAAAVRVQKHFGIGALESIYVRCLERELELAGHRTSREKGVSITYRGMTRTNRGARPSACGNATGGIDPDSRLHSRTASTSFQSRDAPAPKASGCPRRSRAAKRSQEAARLGKATGFCVSARRARLDGVISQCSSAENRAFQRL